MPSGVHNELGLPEDSRMREPALCRSLSRHLRPGSSLRSDQSHPVLQLPARHLWGPVHGVQARAGCGGPHGPLPALTLRTQQLVPRCQWSGGLHLSVRIHRLAAIVSTRVCRVRGVSAHPSVSRQQVPRPVPRNVRSERALPGGEPQPHLQLCSRKHRRSVQRMLSHTSTSCPTGTYRPMPSIAVWS